MQYDEIGLILDNSATYDYEGNELTAPAYKDGWHVNTLEPVEEWEQYRCSPQPTTPYRIYAGGIMPVCYRFPDEQTFKDILPKEEEGCT